MDFELCQENVVCVDLNQIIIQQESAIVCLLFLMMKHCELIRNIPNANLTPTKYMCVCEKHFTVEEISIFHMIGDTQVSTVIKTTVDGIHKRLPGCDLIRSVNNHQMVSMEKFVARL